ncbi:hypothetical protein [Streptomyces paromomycinus]|uniref:Uncharacterized protein n=1 Tax=Streptomyces paromomycinus TaxID=92743 RepID=A0A401WD45_STREY|nr:hypothetical protein [Streptomyces paromomycinus]GCD47238.1 hypothetical protein GKJPGBOP_07004 [Streptomyces paromomycinus]
MSVRTGYRHSTCLALDVQAYGGNNDRRQSEIQHELPRLLEQAAHRAGLDRSRWHFQPKGDEQLAVLPMDGSEPRVIDDYMRHIASELHQHNRLRVEEAWLRLRASVHHGLVEVADNGFAGRTVVTTSRLLASDVLHRALKAADQADLVVALSDDVYDATVVGGHTTLRPDAFRPVTIHEKELRTVAWLWAPGDDVHRLDLGAYDTSPRDRDMPDSHGPRQRDKDWQAGPVASAGTGADDHRMPPPVHGHQVSQNNFHDPVNAPGSVFGISNSHG